MYIKMEYKISEEKYNKLIELKNTNTKEFHEGIEEIACSSPFPPNAYGCEIPMDVFEKDGKYYASWNRYSSCD